MFTSLCCCFCSFCLSFKFCFLTFQLFLLEFLTSFHLINQSLTNVLRKLAEAMFAEGFALVIVHCTLERFAATMASETCRMPNLANSTDTIILHNLLATRTDLTEHLVVVELAICLAIMLKVATLDEGLTADAAAKTLRMPRAGKGSKRTTDDGLATTSTNVLDKLIVATVAVVLAVVLLAIATHEIAAA